MSNHLFFTLFLLFSTSLSHGRREIEREFQNKLNKVNISYNSLIRLQNVYSGYL